MTSHANRVEQITRQTYAFQYPSQRSHPRHPTSPIGGQFSLEFGFPRTCAHHITTMFHCSPGGSWATSASRELPSCNPCSSCFMLHASCFMLHTSSLRRIVKFCSYRPRYCICLIVGTSTQFLVPLWDTVLCRGKEVVRWEDGRWTAGDGLKRCSHRIIPVVYRKDTRQQYCSASGASVTVRSTSPSRRQRPRNGGRCNAIFKRLAQVIGDVNRVLLLHACLCVVVGGVAFVIPHSLVMTLFGSTYSHFQHELVRMYGALTLAQGWVVFKVRRIEDGRIRRAISEAFCIAYGLQAIALLRAQLTVPESHTLWNTAGWLSFACLALFYGYCRWFKTIKVFQLPGSRG